MSVLAFRRKLCLPKGKFPFFNGMKVLGWGFADNVKRLFCTAHAAT
jgi:hypothetical protein